MQEGQNGLSQKIAKGLKVFLWLASAFLVIPPTIGFVSPGIAIALGVLVGVAALVALFKPNQYIGLGGRGTTFGVLLIAMATAGVGGGRISEENRLAKLKQTDPTAYLAEIKETRGGDAWRNALREIDPPTYAKELARLEAERAAEKERAERERLAAKKRAEQERIAAEKREKEAKQFAAKQAFKTKCESTNLAYIMAQRYVEQSLKAPSTADFPWYSDQFVRYLGDCTHQVASYVDAQNGFGAQIRTHYMAKLKYKGNDTWQLVDLKF